MGISQKIRRTFNEKVLAGFAGSTADAFTLFEKFDEKLEQNEELAELRADTSLTKQAMSQAGKIQNDMMKMADVKILKGPKR